MAEFHDQVSGRKAERPELKKALEAGRYDVLLFWSLDRLSRQGVLPTLLLLNQLSQYDVGYRRLQEQWIDSLGAFRDAVIAILATVAKFEAERLSSRVRRGLERARSQNKVLGRPRVVVDRSRIARLRDQRLSLREVAAKTGKSTTTVQRAPKLLVKRYSGRMAVDDPGVVDIISESQVGCIVLTISDHLDWQESTSHQL